MSEMKMLDMNSYPRAEHFRYFSAMKYPYVGATVKVDITGFLEKVRAQELPFFLSFLYLAASAANSVPEFRRRIMDGGIAEYESCPTSHTVALPDGTYCYCILKYDLPFPDFIPYAQMAQEEAKAAKSIDDGAEPLPLIFVSTVPWLAYESIVQPVPDPPDSNPRITWGKYTEENGRAVMPVTVLCNHALVDGAQIGAFFAELSRLLESFPNINV